MRFRVWKVGSLSRTGCVVDAGGPEQAASAGHRLISGSVCDREESYFVASVDDSRIRTRVARVAPVPSRGRQMIAFLEQEVR